MHVKNMLQQYGYDDSTIQVYLEGGSVEDADISDPEYIKLESDNSLFYYSPPKASCYKAKSLKIIVRAYCKNSSCVKFMDSHYCELCYRDLRDVPRISLIT
jgi:hypothetical protein